MTAYFASPFQPPPFTLQPGQIGYCFEAFDADGPATRMQVTTTAPAASVATIGVVVEGVRKNADGRRLINRESLEHWNHLSVRRTGARLSLSDLEVRQ